MAQVPTGSLFYVASAFGPAKTVTAVSNSAPGGEIDDHKTRRVVNGQVKTFRYVEPISRHNLAKHFVDDVNNRRHDPIGLDQGWPTKRWDHRQLAFFLSVAEVNAVNSQVWSFGKNWQGR